MHAQAEEGTARVVIVGAEGNVGKKLIEVLSSMDGIDIVGLVDPKFAEQAQVLGGDVVEFYTGEEKYPSIGMAFDMVPDESSVIWIDFTSPSAVTGNIAGYSVINAPYIVGTTGWSRQALLGKHPTAPCVIAPNMSPTLVGIQAMLEYGAENFKNLFQGFNFTIEESHRKGKADVSGTARLWAEIFADMGAPPNPPIDYVRSEERPHGYHVYRLSKGGIGRDGVRVTLSTKIDDQYEYVNGVILAIEFIRSITAGERGPVSPRYYSMTDVLMDKVIT